MPDGSIVLNGGRSRRGKPRGPPGSKDWVQALKGCDDSLFIDFLRRCLAWEPSERMTPSQVTLCFFLFENVVKITKEIP